jgi:hypothetical protein
MLNRSSTPTRAADPVADEQHDRGERHGLDHVELEGGRQAALRWRGRRWLVGVR